MNILQQNVKILENKTQKEYNIEANFDEISKLAFTNFKERKKVYVFSSVNQTKNVEKNGFILILDLAFV